MDSATHHEQLNVSNLEGGAKQLIDDDSPPPLRRSASLNAELSVPGHITNQKFKFYSVLSRDAPQKTLAKLFARNSDCEFDECAFYELVFGPSSEKFTALVAHILSTYQVTPLFRLFRFRIDLNFEIQLVL